MTARDLIDRASIQNVWEALGGGPLRHGRGAAWWRDGDGDNIALDESKGCWYDHAHGKGGGILDLIQTVLGSDRRDAVRWLADHRSVNLDNDRPLTRDEKRRYAQRRSHAESKARNLTKWRCARLRRRRGDRNRLYLSENASSSVARTLLAETGGIGDEEQWDYIFSRCHDDQRADQVDREIRRIESATPAELVSSTHAEWEVA